VEEHFYMAWPAAVRYLSRRGVAVVAVLVCLVCPALRASSFIIGRGMGWTDYGAYTWLVADSLATGALLAAALRSATESRRTSWKFLLTAYSSSAALVLFGARFGILSRSTLVGMTLRQSALNLFFLGFLASFLLLSSSRWKAWVFISPLQFLGAISYGVYLIHGIVFGVLDRVAPLVCPQFLQAASTQLSWMTLRFVIAVGLTLVAAYLSRWHFEEFFLRLKQSA
jgi:peptidoglycan/LPS O-acetylase OafA/YrhL